MRSTLLTARFCVMAGLAAAAINAAVFVPALATGFEGITNFSGSTAGATVTATNTGSGSAFRGLTGTAAGSMAVRGTSSGLLSYGIYGESLSTDKTHPSYGVYGSSRSGYSIYASATMPGLTALFATNTDTTNAGSHAIFAKANADAIISSSTNGVGVRSTSANGIGLFGSSTNGDAIQGLSRLHHGVVGTTGYAGSISNSHAGVLGIDQSTSGLLNDGVAGLTTLGVGVYGASSGAAPSFGVYGYSSSSVAVEANVGVGNPLQALEVDSGGSTAASGAIGVFNGSGTHILGLFNNGDLVITGHLTTCCTGPLVATQTSNGHAVVTYGAQQSQPTVEDFGKGYLVSGQAYVRIDAAFAATLDPRSEYFVFITPRGDNRGLYVAQKMPAGFAIREGQSGRSTLAFDYRIVGRPLGSAAAPRLPAMDSVVAAHQHMKSLLRLTPKELRGANVLGR